jgi:hypothetical protein
MQRIIYVPQYPTKMRYSEWWWNTFEEEFFKAGFEVRTLGGLKKVELEALPDLGLFAPIKISTKLELAQIEEYMQLELRDDDILFFSDISYPGYFPHVLFHKRPSKVFGFCHATSKNYLDYYAPNVKHKFPIETALAGMCDKVFVATKYHAKKLGWENTVVTSLPYPNFLEERSYKYNGSKRPHLVMSASRNNPQKVDDRIEKTVELKVGEIFRPTSNSWSEYCGHLGASKILLITSFEDTFGYQIVDGIIHGCVVLAPNRCAYPELLTDKYLYSSECDLLSKIEAVIQGRLAAPSLLCEEQMKNFFKTIMEVMKK